LDSGISNSLKGSVSKERILRLALPATEAYCKLDQERFLALTQTAGYPHSQPILKHDVPAENSTVWSESQSTGQLPP